MLEIMASTSSTGTAYPSAVTDPAPVESRIAADDVRGERRKVERLQRQVAVAVTREVRMPLTSIQGSLRLVATGALGPMTPEASELLAIAGRTCGQLIGLIDDLLERDQEDRPRFAKPFEPSTLAAQLRAALGIG